MTVEQLAHILTQAAQKFPHATVKAQGWNDMGDLMDFELRGDVRVERDVVGNSVIVLR